MAGLAMALALADVAEAAQRYAAPAGSGPEPCVQANPCALEPAVKKAKAGDEVIVGAGSYTIGAPVYPEGLPQNVFIHGDFGGPMPKVEAKGVGSALSISGSGSRLSYLWLTASQSTPVACFEGATLERIRSEASGEFGAAMSLGPKCTARDSLALSTGKGGYGLVVTGSLSTSTAVARNVTAIASGANSYGVYSTCFACIPIGSISLNLKNAIVSGGAYDLITSGPAAIEVGNSNFDGPEYEFSSVTDLGGNQSAPPLFVDAPAGDYREAPGSPTIDAGVSDALGATDLAGNPRTIGSAPDIGAYEFVPPTPPSPPAAPTASAPPPPPAGEIESLGLAPATFRTVNAGEAIFSAKGKRKPAPVGTTVTYSLSAAATVAFTVERRTVGRKAGRKCVKATKANEDGKKCPLFKPVPGGFTHAGQKGQNSFKFSGRIDRALPPGAYRLTGSAGGAARTASFRIVR
ncbi:MAG TPA: choice-of-anchor Q domain-containing protein [Solirubrobacterales bacterium]|nr:choice-of-anchor Q domain-containing protein [Solirubrobacterales bacterium]